MRYFGRSFLYFFSMLILLWSSPWSCGGGNNNTSVTTTNDYSPTSTDVSNVADSSMNVIDSLSSSSSNNISASLKENMAESGVSLRQNAITTTTASSCSIDTFPSPNGNITGTVEGSTLSGGGSGSFTLRLDVSDDGNSAQGVLDFNLFNASSMTEDLTFDGKLGTAEILTQISSTQFTAQKRILTQDFQVYFRDSSGATKICDVSENLLEQVALTIGSSTIDYQRTVSGCIGACGEFFSVDGGSSGSIPIPQTN